MAEAAAAALIVRRLEKAADRAYRADMGPRYGIHTDKAFGVRVVDLRRMAKEIGRDHALAHALWKTGWYDARLLAGMVADPEKLTGAEMDRWRRDFDNWGICDTLCFDLFDRSPLAFAKIDKWATLKDEFGKRAAFALLASVALHRKDAADAEFVKRLPLIEAASGDARNFVKQGVNWALRAIGGRNRKLHAAAVTLSRTLAASEDATARWIGKDALRQLASPATAKRIAGKS